MKFVSLLRLALPLLLMVGVGTRMIVPMLSAMAVLGLVAMGYRKIYGRYASQASKYSSGKKIVYGEYSVVDDDEESQSDRM